MIKNYTPQDLKTAYQLVQQDLFNNLSKAKDKEIIKLGSLGKFVKSECQIKSALFKEELGDNNTFIYYRINFKPFSKLKALLTNQIINKYRLKKKTK